jgi:N-acetylmuramoyl-L-alanine amidase
VDGIGYLIVLFAGHFETVPTIATTLIPIIRACSILQPKDITEFENGHIDRAFGAVHDRDLECIVVLVNLCTVKFDLGSDVFVELSDRCYIANRAKASIFISVHCNSATSVSANGTEVYYCYGANSTDLANKVYKQMINEMPLIERGVKQNNYVVIRDTEMPAILCELAFISNYSDRMKLTDPECQAKWAKAICKGICAYYGVSYLELD